MAKETGLGITTLSVDDSGGSVCTIVNDITNFTVSTPRAVQDTTGVDKSAMERLQLLADASVALNGVFNDAASQAHVVFKTVPSTSVMRTTSFSISGQTLGMELFYTDYNLARPASGELTWSTTGVLANGTAPAWS